MKNEMIRASSLLPSLLSTFSTITPQTLRDMLTFGNPAYNPALCEFAACVLWALMTPEEQAAKQALIVNGRGYGKHTVKYAHYFVGRIVAERTRGVAFGHCVEGIVASGAMAGKPRHAMLSNTVARHAGQLYSWFTDAEFRGDISAIVAISDSTYHVGFKGAVSYYLADEAKRGIAHRIAGYLA